MKYNSKQDSLLESDPRRKVKRAERPKIKRSRIVMPLDDGQLSWALAYDPGWVLNQVGAGQ